MSPSSLCLKLSSVSCCAEDKNSCPESKGSACTASTVQYQYNVSHVWNVNFSSSHLKKIKTDEINSNNILYLTQSKILSFPNVISIHSY